MPEVYPAKLALPIASGNQFEITIRNNERKTDFEAKVLDNCPGITNFKIITNNPNIQTLGQVKRHQFKMQINSQEYTVYPDWRSVYNDYESTKNVQEVY